MSYVLEYKSDFYNYFQKLVSVKIYKDGYEGEVVNVRISQVKIENNYQDDDTPVVGKGVKIIVIADVTDMTYLEDILLSYEKEFLCTIEYDGTVVFRGFSLCDLNERQLLPYAAVTLQFTDYLHRSEGAYPSILRNMGSVTNLLALVQEMIDIVDLEYPLYVNSTLFEDSMDVGVTDTWLPQVCLQNSIFYNTSFDFDNIYDAINKALSSFNAFIYLYNDKWIIERQEDITREGDWVKYVENLDSASALPEGEVTASLKQSYNKQDGDWEYVDCSQIIEYDSGFKTLILNLQDKLLETLIFNDWPSPDSIYKTAFATPASGTLDYRTWYVHDALTDLATGNNLHDIAQWIYFVTGTNVQGLYYHFVAYFNQSSDSDDTVLSIKYSMSSDKNMADTWMTGLYFLLRVDGGPYDGAFLKLSGLITIYDPSGSLEGPIALNLITSDSVFYISPITYCATMQSFDVSDGETTTWEMEKELNLSDLTVRVYNSGTTYDQYDNLESILGYPEYQRLIMMFMPPRYTDNKGDKMYIIGDTHVYPNAYLGDIRVTINAEEIDNKITYSLDKSFVKTREVDLYLFDAKNMNYGNALLEADEFTRTDAWTSENCTNASPLYEVFAMCKFRKWGRTMHRLKATILCDLVLKPFSLLTDDTIVDESGVVITFLLNAFTWDLVRGQYEIEAEEYTEEEVIVDGIAYDSYGNPVVYPPDAPVGVFVRLMEQYFHPIRITWNSVGGGIIGYKVERKPWWNGSIWDDTNWTLIYAGTGTRCTENLYNRGGTQPTYPETLYYRVCAYNSAGNGSWSDVEDVVWSP